MNVPVGAFKKGLLFLIICGCAIFSLLCSDEFVVGLAEKEKIVLTGSLEKVSGFTIFEGYRDPLPILTIKGQNEDTLQELDLSGGDAAYDSLMSRVKRFSLSWEKVSGAEGYEVRVSKKPITPLNWLDAQKVSLKNIRYNDSRVLADAILETKPLVRSGTCIGCGECAMKCPVNAISMKGGKAVIDYRRCVECGDCFRTCRYTSIDGFFAGTNYYFAIRSFNSNKEYSQELFCTSDAYRLQYTTIASIHDTVGIKKNNIITAWNDSAQVWDTFPNPVRGCKGSCGFRGCYINDINLTDCFPLAGFFDYADTSTIASVSVCPVDAIYSVERGDSVAIKEKVTEGGSIFINKEKCVNCGRCALQCYAAKGHGSVTTEVVRVVSRLFGM